MAEPKTIAVTGASRGIGAAIARELARRGYTVACLTRKGSGPEDGGPAHAGFVNTPCSLILTGRLASKIRMKWI